VLLKAELGMHVDVAPQLDEAGIVGEGIDKVHGGAVSANPLWLVRLGV
jgi:hypothetical protein